MYKQGLLISALIFYLQTSSTQTQKAVGLSRKRHGDSYKRLGLVHPAANIDFSGMTHSYQQIVERLTNHLNGISYTGDLYFGSPMTPAQLVYDTGSGWLTVTGSSCGTCGTGVYNPSDSNSSSQVDNSTQYLNYGSASLQGLVYEDSVCISDESDSCTNKFTFFSITSQSGLNNCDGILGLSPDEEQNGPSYIRELKNSGVIDQKMISFYLSQSDDSSMMFGGYNSSMIKAGSEDEGLGMIHWQDLTGTSYWEVEIQDIIVEGDSAFSDTTSRAILDSGTSLITVPNKEFLTITSTLQSSHSDIYCQSSPAMCYFMSSCADKYSKLQHIKIQLGDNKIFSVAPEDYLLEDVEGTSTYCIIGISGSDYGLFILGDSFLRSYYSIYDFENQRAGLAIHINSNAVITKKAPNYVLIIVFSVIGLLIVVVIGICCYRRYRLKKQRAVNQAFYHQYSQQQHTILTQGRQQLLIQGDNKQPNNNNEQANYDTNVSS